MVYKQKLDKLKELFKDCKCIESEFKCPKCKNNITFIKNIIVSIISFICICLISRNNIIKGLTTFYFFFVIFAYFIHYFTHNHKSITTILHHYHHFTDNWFSHFIQISAELTIIIYFFPIYYFTDTKYFDIWVVIYYLLLYSSIHNINYGYLRVNNFHELHHKNPLTNHGPDFCDIFFGTKNELFPDTEDVSHYIPNLIIGAVIILILQFICLNKTYEEYLKKTFIYFEFSFTLICVISSIYIYHYYPDVLK
jgi:hypothetical protein